VVAGKMGWLEEQHALPRFLEKFVESGRIVFPGFVSELDKYILLRNARATLYPSLFEGFGLPVLEAMACGAPVLTTHCTSLPEVGGEAVAYTEPDAESITDSLRALLDDPERREALADAGYARSQEFTWAASAEAHMACYRRAAEQHAADVSAV